MASDIVDGMAKRCLNGGVGVARILRGHNADDLAVAVEERAAGVAGVDGAVDLDHVKGRAVNIDARFTQETMPSLIENVSSPSGLPTAATDDCSLRSNNLY